MKTINMSQFAQRVAKLGGDLNTSAVRAFQKAGDHLEGQVVVQISTAEPHPAVDTGHMRQSVTKHNLPNGCEVTVDAPYSASMEFGTRPFTPPLAPLLEWATRKVGARDAYPLARGAQRAIAEKGISPRHFYKKAWDKINGYINHEMKAELARLKRANGG